MRSVLMASVILLAGDAVLLRAQCGRVGPGLPPSAPGAIVGVVTDTAGTPLEGIRILISRPRRDERSDASGRFRIDSLAAGTYEISVRRLGFEPASAVVEVRKEGGSVRICLSVQARGLAPIVTSTFRGGLSGVVADSANRAVPNAEVRALAAQAVTTTDSMGQFFLDLEKGSYALVVHKKGFARQMLSVTVPKDSGRQIAVWLTPADGRENRRAAELDGLRERILHGTGFRYKLLSREVLFQKSMDLTQWAQFIATKPLHDGCPVYIGGEPRVVVPLWSLKKEEVELFEVVISSNSARQRQSIKGRQVIPGSTMSSGCGVVLVAWLRQ